MAQTNKYSVALKWTLNEQELAQAFKLLYQSYKEGPSEKIGNADISLLFYPSGGHESNIYRQIVVCISCI